MRKTPARLERIARGFIGKNLPPGIICNYAEYFRTTLHKGWRLFLWDVGKGNVSKIVTPLQEHLINRHKWFVEVIIHRWVRNR